MKNNKMKLALFGAAILFVVTAGFVSVYALNGEQKATSTTTTTSVDPVKSCGCSAGATSGSVGSCSCGAEGGCGCGGSCGGTCGCASKTA